MSLTGQPTSHVVSGLTAAPITRTDERTNGEVPNPPDQSCSLSDAHERQEFDEPALFDMQPITLPTPEPVEKLSADRRRTLRQRADVERGVHPLTGRRIHEDETRKCGNCSWRQLLDYHRRAYPKCMFPGAASADVYERFGPPRVSHSAASDVRAWWPGCRDHEWGDPKVSADAARWVPER